MSISIQERAGKHQLRIKHKLLPTAFFHTFESHEAAAAYGKHLHDMLDKGIVPTELLAKPAKTADDAVFTSVVLAYLNEAPGLTDSDDELLPSILKQREVEGLRVSGITARWAEGYIGRLKARKLAPGTIRKRIGALARVLDWHLRRDHQAGENEVVLNPLRVMPDGYSVYTASDLRTHKIDVGDAPVDEERDRRLAAEEEARVRDALAGAKRDDRERPWPGEPAFTMLFELILNTGMRLAECYCLRVDQLDLARRVINVEGTKGKRGARKPRVVPIGTALAAKLEAWIKDRVGLVFPFWDGTKEDRRRCGARLSAKFATLFAYAKVDDFTEHDMRHEATCRWFTLRDARGAWIFSDTEICRIMGWKKADMALRYASLRGEDLSARLA